MKQIVAELLSLLEREPAERELWELALTKLRNSTAELRQAHSAAIERYDERIKTLRDEVEELQGKLALLSFNDPAGAKKVAEEMATINAILKAAESIPVFEYCVKETQEERRKVEQAYSDSEQAEQVYFSFRRDIQETLDNFELALIEKNRHEPWGFSCNLTWLEVNSIAEILVGKFKSEPGKPMPGDQQQSAMKQLLWRSKGEAAKNAQAIIEKRKRSAMAEAHYEK
jgi:hypothetical protein